MVRKSRGAASNLNVCMSTQRLPNRAAPEKVALSRPKHRRLQLEQQNMASLPGAAWT